MSLREQAWGKGMVADKALRLVEFLAARFSHDLSGIATGLEGAIDAAAEKAAQRTSMWRSPNLSPANSSQNSDC